MNTKEQELKEFTSASISITPQACERIKKAMKFSIRPLKNLILI